MIKNGFYCNYIHWKIEFGFWEVRLFTGISTYPWLHFILFI